MSALARPLVMLLQIVWRFRIGRIALITLYALFAPFAWLAQGAVGAWTSGSQYFLLGLVVLGLLLGPAAVVLGVTQPSRSWRWGLWLTWPTVLLSVSLLASPQLSTLAVISLPLVTVPAVCALAWIAAVGRESIGGLLAKPPSNEDAEPDTSLMPMTDEELAAEASWDRPVNTARERDGRKHRRRRS
jgi:peptidoglycan/LPS O-acetylase OafA/YrhL